MSQFKDKVTWGHNVAQSSEKATRIIDLAKTVARDEIKQKGNGFYVVLSPREGQHFSQPTRLEIIMNHDQDHLQQHRNSKAYQQMQEAINNESLLEKKNTMSFTQLAGFSCRKDAATTPPGDQFIWIAKLDSHPRKFDEFVNALKMHASNVERTEDETLSFLVLQSHDSENSVTLFERYTNEEYFKNVHSASESMQEYRKKMESLMADRITAGFKIVAGYVDKRETPAIGSYKMHYDPPE